MKKLLLAATLAYALVPVTALAQSGEGFSLRIDKDNRTISVSASDHAEAEPDIADLSIGFTAYGPTLQAAYKNGSDNSNAITKALLDTGAKRSDIQSRSQRVNRLDDAEVKIRKGMRYSVQQSWTVSVAPDKAALILDAAVQAGANQSGDITWRMKSSVSLDAEAIRRATERAHAMAVQLAQSLGVTLGKPVYATNSVSGVAVPMMGRNYSMLAMDKNIAPAPLSIEAQKVERNATVQIIYSIE